MTLPIQPIQLGSTGVVPSDAEQFLDQLLKGSEIRQREQQLATEKDRLKLEQQKYKEAQAQHDEEKAQLAQVGEIARNLFLSMQPPTMLPAGSLPGAGGQMDVNLGPQGALAQMIQGLPAQAVPQLLPLLQQMGTLQGTAANTQGQQLANRSAAQTQADAAAIDRLVSGLETQPLTRQTIGRTLLRVAAIDPAKAQQLAGPLGSLVEGGAYTAHINENGTVTWISNEPGRIAGAPLQPKSGDVDQRKASGFARRVLEASAVMTDLENKHPNIGQQVDDWIRTLRAGGQLPAVGKSVETLFTPALVRLGEIKTGIPNVALRAYLNARYDLGNAILRNVSGATINDQEIDREVTPYVPMKGMGMDAVPDIQQRRLALGLQFADQAGVEFRPERLTPAARRYYLRALTGHPAPDAHQDLPLQQRPGETLRPR